MNNTVFGTGNDIPCVDCAFCNGTGDSPIADDCCPYCYDLSYDDSDDIDDE